MKFLDIRSVNLRKDLIAKIADKGTRIHVIFCTALLFLFCILVFSSRYAISLIPRAIVSYLLLLACAYTGRWIWKRWLASDNWLVLIMSYIGAALLYSVIAAFSYMYFLDLRFEGSGLFVMFVTIPGFVIVFLVGGGFVAITRAARREQVRRLLVTQQQKDSELGLLMSQLNPHFLFNTLNNLYGLSITQQEKIPALLLKLADLLRYSVYESGKDFVSLNDELAYITNYIELEKIRLAGKLNLNVQLEKVSDGIRIAPMLLITFVENAFKHAKNTVGQKIAIDVNLSVVAGCISFAVGNSYHRQVDEIPTIVEAGGIGLKNATKRLDLLYGSNYSLNQRKSDNYYRAELILKVK
jgi:sensor histidine kinase YesM